MLSDRFVARFSNTIGARGLRAIGKLNVPAYRWSGGRIGNKVGDGPGLLLTTTGRKSGEPRTAPIPYLPPRRGDDPDRHQRRQREAARLVPQPASEAGGRGRDRASQAHGDRAGRR